MRIPQTGGDSRVLGPPLCLPGQEDMQRQVMQSSEADEDLLCAW